MNKIKEIQIETSASGRHAVGHPEYVPAQFITSITFTTDHYAFFQDKALLTQMLEQFMEIEKRLAKNEPVTDLIQVK